jgi:hypothetical protein
VFVIFISHFAAFLCELRGKRFSPQRTERQLENAEKAISSECEAPKHREGYHFSRAEEHPILRCVIPNAFAQRMREGPYVSHQHDPACTGLPRITAAEEQHLSTQHSLPG